MRRLLVLTALSLPLGCYGPEIEGCEQWPCVSHSDCGADVLCMDGFCQLPEAERCARADEPDRVPVSSGVLTREPVVGTTCGTATCAADGVTFCCEGLESTNSCQTELFACTRALYCDGPEDCALAPGSTCCYQTDAAGF